MRLRTIQAGPLMQMPVFLILFFAPVYVPLELLSGWIHGVARAEPDHLHPRGGAEPARRRAERGPARARARARLRLGDGGVGDSRPPAGGDCRMTPREVWPGHPSPARCELGRLRDELLTLLRERRAGRALPLRRRRRASRSGSSFVRAPRTSGTSTFPASARGNATAIAARGCGSRRAAICSTRQSF